VLVAASTNQKARVQAANDLALLTAAHEIMLLLPKQGMTAPAFNIHGTHDVILLLIGQAVIACYKRLWNESVVCKP
jgi:hypothetical protein